jgi:hypothetical protein
MQHSATRYIFIASIVIATNVLASAQDIDKGRIEFLSKCAECHGADGKGAGPMSSRLKTKPADLTVLAKRNNGVFSPDAVAEAVDGRSESHRDTEMPIWGCRQGPPPDKRKGYEPKGIDSLLDIPCDSEQVARSRILDVVEYLGRIQE